MSTRSSRPATPGGRRAPIRLIVVAVLVATALAVGLPWLRGAIGGGPASFEATTVGRLSASAVVARAGAEDAGAFSPQVVHAATDGARLIVVVDAGRRSFLALAPLLGDEVIERVAETCLLARGAWLSADASSIAVACESGRGERTIQIRDAKTLEPIREVRLSLGNGEPPLHRTSRVPAVDPGLTRAAVVAGGNRIEVFDLESGRRLGTLETEGGDEPVSSLALSTDGRMLAAGYGDGRIAVWDTASGDGVAVFAPRLPDQGPAIAFAPDGTRLASASFWGHFHLWSLEDRGLVHHQPSPRDTYGANDLAFAADAPVMVQVRAGTALLRGADGALFGRIAAPVAPGPPGPFGPPSGLRGFHRTALSPSGREVLAVGFREVEVWRLQGAAPAR
jgi:hypothetical protein